MKVYDIPLEARMHFQCADSHYLSYHCWAWQLVDDSVLQDCGKIVILETIEESIIACG
jgi:hypothetical protein